MVLGLSDIVATQLPVFIRENYPRFLSFLKYYYAEQERTGGSLDILNNYVNYFDVNYQNYGSSAESVLAEDIDSEQNEIVCTGIELFPLVDGYVKIDEEIIFYDVRENQTLKNCKRGRTYRSSLGGQIQETSPAVHSAGSVVYDISSLFLEIILARFQEQLLNNFPYRHIIKSIDRRQIIKYIKDFYVAKGTKDSLRFIFNILLESNDDELDRYAPKDFIYRLSDSDYEDSYGIYVKLIRGSVDDLVGELLTQENSNFSVPVDGIRNQGNSIYKILINEIEYNGNFDFDKDLIHKNTLLRPITVLDDLTLLSNGPYHKIGQKLEYINSNNNLPIDFVFGDLYENDKNYFLDVNDYIHIIPKNPSFFPTGEIVDRNIGVFIDGTPIRSYFGEKVQYGYITEIKLIDKGFGYSAPPYVIIDYEPGRAKAVLIGDVIDRIEIDRSLVRNYQGNVPNVEITTGRNAKISPVITDGRITSLVIDDGGEYYSEPPDIVIQDLVGKGRDALYKSIINSDGVLVGYEKFAEGLLYSDSTEVFIIPAANDSRAVAVASLSTFNRVDKTNTPIDLLFTYDKNFKDKMLSPRDGLRHSNILGYAYDGNPIYGPYGYSNPFKVSPIKLMESGWRLKNTLDFVRPSGDRGNYVEDYEYVYSWDHLDICNGRFCVTPEYPDGVYAYFLTMSYNENANDQLFHKSIFPYVIGERFYSRPALQVPGLKLSQINGIRLVGDSITLDTFESVINQVSSGSIEGFDIGVSGNNFKLSDRLVFEKNRELNVIVSSIRKGGIERVTFDYGVIIEIDRNIYADSYPVHSIYYSTDSKIELFYNTNNSNKILGRITGELQDRLFTRFNVNDPTDIEPISTDVFVELTLTKLSFFTKGSILSFYDDRGNKSSRTSEYEVLESVVNSNKVVIRFSVNEEENKRYYVEQHTQYLDEVFNYQENIIIRSTNPDDTQDSFISGYKDLSFEFEIFNIGTNFGVVEFDSPHGIGLMQDIQFGGFAIGLKKFVVYLNTNGKISFRDNESIDVSGEDIYFYRGIDYILDLDRNVNIQFLDFTYYEDVDIPVFLPEITRINERRISIRFTENTQYSHLYIFDRGKIQSTFGNKIIVTDSPLSGPITSENFTDTTLAFVTDKETRYFPTNGFAFNQDYLSGPRTIRNVAQNLSKHPKNVYTSFYFSYISIKSPSPTQIGQIDGLTTLGGNNDLFELPKVLGVENQIVKYVPQILNGELVAFGGISHDQKFKSPSVVLYIGNRYVDNSNFTLFTDNGYVISIVLKNPIKVNGEIDLKIIEDDVEIFPYSTSIGNVVDVDTTYEYDIPNDISRLPIIKTTNTYVLDRKHEFLVGDNVKLLGDRSFANSFVISTQGNNVVTITNSDFDVDAQLITNKGAQAIVKGRTSSRFSPSIVNGVELIDSHVGRGTGHIGDSTQRIQDGKFYQDHSYVVLTQRDISDWRSYVEETIHPAGFELFGELYQKYTTELQPQTVTSEVNYNFNYDVKVVVDVNKSLEFDIQHKFDTNIERGSGSISTSGGIDDIGIVLVNVGNEVNDTGLYELVDTNGNILTSTPLDALLYSVNGIFVDIVQYDDTNRQTVNLTRNWDDQNDFYGLGFLKDDSNPRYNQRLKNIFQRSGRWLDAANLIEINIDNLLKWVSNNDKITAKSYYTTKSIIKFRQFIDSVLFSLRFGGNNKVFDFVSTNEEMVEDLKLVVNLLIPIVQKNLDKITDLGLKNFNDLPHIPEDGNENICNNIVEFLGGLIDVSELVYPDYINNETTDFDLFWDDGTVVELDVNEDLFIVVDGILQVPNESYIIDKTGETAKLCFTEPLKWRQTMADKLSNMGLNISTFSGYNLNPYYVLDLEYSNNEWVLVDSITKVKKQINYPLAVLLFIDGVLQQYGSVYTIEGSIVKFVDGTVLEGRSIHARYLYDKDINIEHYIHDYWEGKYFSRANLYIPYIGPTKELYEFMAMNKLKIVHIFQGDVKIGRVVGLKYVPERLGFEIDLLTSTNIDINKKENIDFHFKVT